jgi:hypothetical protein
MKIFLLVLILIISNTYLYAADWTFIGNTRAGDSFYIDKSSIKKKDSLSTVKEKQIFNFKQISQNGNVYDNIVLIKTYDCSNRSFSILEAIGQDIDGKTVFNEKFVKFYEQNPSKKWQKVGSNSLFLKSYNIACN